MIIAMRKIVQAKGLSAAVMELVINLNMNVFVTSGGLVVVVRNQTVRANQTAMDTGHAMVVRMYQNASVNLIGQDCHVTSHVSMEQHYLISLVFVNPAMKTQVVIRHVTTMVLV